MTLIKFSAYPDGIPGGFTARLATVLSYWNVANGVLEHANSNGQEELLSYDAMNAVSNGEIACTFAITATRDNQQQIYARASGTSHATATGYFLRVDPTSNRVRLFSVNPGPAYSTISTITLPSAMVIGDVWAMAIRVEDSPTAGANDQIWAAVWKPANPADPDADRPAWQTANVTTGQRLVSGWWGPGARQPDLKYFYRLGMVAGSGTATLSDPAAPPIANAGPDQTVAPGASVALDGTGSAPGTPGNALTYQWVQTGGTAVTLSGATTSAPTFNAPSPSSQITLSMQLTVTETSTGQTSLDTVSIIVQAVPASAKPVVESYTANPPTAGQGRPQTLTIVGSDSDGTIVVYKHTPSTGLVLDTTTDAVATVLGSTPIGTYSSTAEVQDNAGVWSDPVAVVLEVVESNIPTGKLLHIAFNYTPPPGVASITIESIVPRSVNERYILDQLGIMPGRNRSYGRGGLQSNINVFRTDGTETTLVRGAADIPVDSFGIASVEDREIVGNVDYAYFARSAADVGGVVLSSADSEPAEVTPDQPGFYLLAPLEDDLVTQLHVTEAGALLQARQSVVFEPPDSTVAEVRNGVRGAVKGEITVLVKTMDELDELTRMLEYDGALWYAPRPGADETGRGYYVRIVDVDTTQPLFGFPSVRRTVRFTFVEVAKP